MSCCCSKIYKFCHRIASCNPEADFKKMFTDLPDGLYTVALNFLDSIIKIPIIVLDNQVELDFPTDESLQLNESFTYTGEVVNDSGETVNLIFGGIEYDCIQFSTYYGK